MSNGTAFFMFVALIAGWAFGWANVSNWVVRRHGWQPAFGHLLGFAGGTLSALGLFCVVGALFDGKEALFVRVVMAVLGLLLLAPFVHLRRKVRAMAGATPNTMATPLAAAPQPVAVSAPQSAHKPHASAPARVRTQGITLPCTFIFSYRGQDGDYSQRTVNVSAISSNGGHIYLEGFCHDRMDSRTFRTDRICGDLTDADTGELVPVQRLLSSVRARTSMDYRPPAPAPQSRPAKEWQTSVLFTGFAASRRDELELLADAAGWDVRVAVGKTLDYIVAGPRGGPAKIAKAEEFGVAVIDEDMFRALVNVA